MSNPLQLVIRFSKNCFLNYFLINMRKFQFNDLCQNLHNIMSRKMWIFVQNISIHLQTPPQIRIVAIQFLTSAKNFQITEKTNHTFQEIFLDLFQS